jgi:hypothetical protein
MNVIYSPAVPEETRHTIDREFALFLQAQRDAMRRELMAAFDRFRERTALHADDCRLVFERGPHS